MNDKNRLKRHMLVKDLYDQAVDLPETDQKDFLDAVRRNHPDVYPDLISLLEENRRSDSLLDELASGMIWPALHTLGKDASKLRFLMEEPEDEDLAREDPLIGKTVAQFEIKEAIGRGGMGMVYRAYDTRLERSVALKFLPPALSTDKPAKERFIHEAKAASAVDHPNIATVYDVGETEDGQLFIAMGYYPGETLKERMAREPVSMDQAITFAAQLAGALDTVHRNGVIHRDIKPGNIIITNGDTVKLLDFGLAKLSYASGYTQIGALMGTVAYMSPEQARGTNVDHKTDIWSLGALLYEMLTGELPFQGEDMQSALHGILFKDPKLPEDVSHKIPKSIQAIIGNCLKKNPDERYRSASELHEDMCRAREGLMPAKTGGMKTWNTRKSKRIQKVIIGAFVVLFVIGISLHSMWRNRDYAFESVLNSPITEESGKYLGGSWGDYDNDGDPDLILANVAKEKPSQVYRNEGDGTFTRVTKGALVEDPAGAFYSTWVDLDNDGDLDVFSSTYFNSPNLYYENIGDGSFRKVQHGDWLVESNSTNGLGFADYDNDGDLDLFIANSGEPVVEANRFYRNEGEGEMVAVECAAIGPVTPTHGVLWSDYNGDGYVDLFVPGQEQMLFTNNREGTFSWHPLEEFGIPEFTQDTDIGFTSADFDNDGDLDVLYHCWTSGTSGILYRNERKAGFKDTRYVLPANGQVRIMGAAWGDYDNDGYIDLFVGNALGNSLLYHNEGNGSFSIAEIDGELQTGRASGGVTWIDFDRDGDLDLFIANGFLTEDEQRCDLFKNIGGKNKWIAVQLRGTVSNSYAIGAKVFVSATINGKECRQLREVQLSGCGTFTLGELHFGLGDADIVETLRVEWPSGIVQELNAVAVNQYVTVIETREFAYKGGQSQR